MSRRALITLLLLLACDPGYVYEGEVVDPQGKPIVDATACMKCSQLDDCFAARVDARGHFRLSGIGWRANDCFVRVQAPLRPRRDFPLGPSCTKRRGEGACLEAKIHAVLADQDVAALARMRDVGTCEGAAWWLETEVRHGDRDLALLGQAFERLAPSAGPATCDDAGVVRAVAAGIELLADERVLRTNVDGTPVPVHREAGRLLVRLTGLTKNQSAWRFWFGTNDPARWLVETRAARER